MQAAKDMIKSAFEKRGGGDFERRVYSSRLAMPAWISCHKCSSVSLIICACLPFAPASRDAGV